MMSHNKTMHMYIFVYADFIHISALVVIMQFLFYGVLTNMKTSRVCLACVTLLQKEYLSHGMNLKLLEFKMKCWQLL